MQDIEARSPTESRDFVIDWLRKEMVGPAPGYPLVQINGEEILRPQDPPRIRYACGILFPRGTTYSGLVDADAEESAGVDRADAVPETRESDGGEAASDEVDARESDTTSDNGDREVDANRQLGPSTLGLSFLARVSGGVVVEATWATYLNESRQTAFPTYDLKVGEAPDSVNEPKLWFRKPAFNVVTLSSERLLAEPHFRARLTDPEDPAILELDVVSRPWGERDFRLVTLTLVNGNQSIRPINENCFFQCGFKVLPADSSYVSPYPERPGGSLDDEESSLALLYRHRPNYAVGHGCAADWDVSDGVVSCLRTEVMPVFHQSPVEARGSIEGVTLSMKSLAEMKRAEIVSVCHALAESYEKWIGEREEEARSDPGFSDEMRRTAKRHIDDCRLCLRRIRDGVDLLAQDDDVLLAFRHMNQAMVEQREHYALSSDASRRRGWVIDGKGASPRPVRAYEAPSYPATTQWRPFQLAFILMNLRCMRDPFSEFRDVVDIIWFPTGGGKTEAYLGLAAFTMVLRRLLDPTNAGTTVLMRYTLRLLTTQQFQRAASLICALERMRRTAPAALGSERISIGLWLGAGVTPNKQRDAVADFIGLKSGDAENRFAVLSCPWCGVDMGKQDLGGGECPIMGYRLVGKGNSQRVQFRCDDPGCDFSDEAGLPIEVVDEAIYETTPSLLIGTVDKFAMLPWQPESRKLFGIDNPRAKTPPELVIQDELHLIAGPLGSMVGHYETIIDEFASYYLSGRLVRPRIVASTATIARAKEQVRHVYGREALLYPPQGLKAGESFFAFEGDSAAGRTYVGVLATAMPSHVTAQKAILAALLQAPALLSAPPEVKDPYWTLMTYFNSLRELGRGATLVQADVREHLNAVWDRIGLTKDMGGVEAIARRRFINHYKELTSRMRSSEIPEVLQELFVKLPEKDTVDLCYATNMIQVGLDVGRLSLMMIVGQPKGASEYIQASSRIGRDPTKPGLVVTNFNPFKPRDRSHFESFRSFHENAYRHVEPTSVTPFSLPVCDRAIHALAVALARFFEPRLRSTPEHGIPGQTRARVRKIILDRVQVVAPEESTRAAAVLDRFFDDWDRVHPNFYGDFSGSAQGEPLMWPAGKPLPPQLESCRSTIRQTPSSMRNVDAECEAQPIKDYVVAGGSDG